MVNNIIFKKIRGRWWCFRTSHKRP